MKIEIIRDLDNKAPVKNPLEDKNSQFMQIQQLIDSKRKLLERKQGTLKKIQKQNQFLGVVRDDYLKYQNYITQQKHDQINALQIINSYIDDLTQTGKLSKYNIKMPKLNKKK